MLNLHQWEDNHIISLLIVIYRGKISGTIHVMIILQEKNCGFINHNIHNPEKHTMDLTKKPSESSLERARFNVTKMVIQPD